MEPFLISVSYRLSYSLSFPLFLIFTFLGITFQTTFLHPSPCLCSVLFFFKWELFIYLFMAVLGFRLLCEGFLQLRQVGATLHRSARASHHRGLSRCGAQAPDAQAPDAQAQQLWLTGPVAPRHVGSSQTRARTRVPRTGRQILNHCATREALCSVLGGKSKLRLCPDMTLLRRYFTPFVLKPTPPMIPHSQGLQWRHFSGKNERFSTQLLVILPDSK